MEEEELHQFAATLEPSLQTSEQNLRRWGVDAGWRRRLEGCECVRVAGAGRWSGAAAWGSAA